MRASLVAVALLLVAAGSHDAQAAPRPWHITKTEWTKADEKGFGDFVRAIAMSGCQTAVSCMRGTGNPYRDSDPAGVDFRADCAKWVYMLRAYYASKNGLPFSYVDEISGDAADLRFSATANRAVSRRDLVDNGAGIPVAASLKDIHNKVWSATYRMEASADGPVIPDFYSPKIARGAIHAGTAIYDINGHVGIVYDVTEDGRILYMDAHPDETVSRSVYGPQFGQSPARLGGGFKNFRPLKLVGATAGPNGALVGGHVVLAPNNAIADFSLEQYRGNIAGLAGDGPDAAFRYGNTPLGFFEYVRTSMSGGAFALNPVYELKTAMQSLCHVVKERAIHVDMAIDNGIDKKRQPSHIAGNTAESDDAEWDAYATSAADARLRNSVAQLHGDLVKIVALWQHHDLNIAYDGASLQEALQQTYDAEAQSCRLTYVSSDRKPVTLGLDQILSRLSVIDFDPYHCIERRWGATAAQELSSCKDDAIKTRWYEAEQTLRNQAEAGYQAHPAYALGELENGPRANGADEALPFDLKALIDGMGYQSFADAARPAGH